METRRIRRLGRPPQRWNAAGSPISLPHHESLSFGTRDRACTAAGAMTPLVHHESLLFGFRSKIHSQFISTTGVA